MSSNSTYTYYSAASKADVLEIVLLCHEALAEDSSEPPTYYIRKILDLLSDSRHVSNQSKSELRKRQQMVKEFQSLVDVCYALANAFGFDLDKALDRVKDDPKFSDLL